MEYWEYSTLTGHRGNPDPKKVGWESPFDHILLLCALVVSRFKRNYFGTVLKIPYMRQAGSGGNEESSDSEGDTYGSPEA